MTAIIHNEYRILTQDFIALDAPHRHKLTVHVVPLQNSKNHVATDEVGNEEETTDSDEPDLAEVGTFQPKIRQKTEFSLAH